MILGPNITGRINDFYGELYEVEDLEGCFVRRENGNTKTIGSSWSKGTTVAFDASNSNNSYTKDTIQPKSAYSLMIIKE